MADIDHDTTKSDQIDIGGGLKLASGLPILSDIRLLRMQSVMDLRSNASHWSVRADENQRTLITQQAVKKKASLAADNEKDHWEIGVAEIHPGSAG